MPSTPSTAPLPSPELKIWGAICIHDGETRRLIVEAANEAEARAMCLQLGVGFDGPASRGVAPSPPMPEAYDQGTARRLLGGISRTSLYKELILGTLKRVPGTRRVLVTRSSIEAWTRRR